MTVNVVVSFSRQNSGDVQPWYYRWKTRGSSVFYHHKVRVLSEIFPDFDEISREENKTEPKMPFDFKGLRRAGAFSRVFTIFLTPQCRGFSSALISEKSKSPLFPGSGGAVVTND